jgi:hypothetical protein
LPATVPPGAPPRKTARNSIAAVAARGHTLRVGAAAPAGGRIAMQHPMDELNAIARRHQEDQEAARQAASGGPRGPAVLKAPIVSAWLIVGGLMGFGLGYLALEAIPPAAVCAVLTAVAARLFQGMMRGFGAGAVNRSLGGLPQWLIVGGLIGGLGAAGFMVWLDGLNADVVTPALAGAPAGAILGVLLRGVLLLFGAGRRR